MAFGENLLLKEESPLKGGLEVRKVGGLSVPGIKEGVRAGGFHETLEPHPVQALVKGIPVYLLPKR